MKKSNSCALAFAILIGIAIVAMLFAINDTHAFVDYDSSKIQNPYTNFNTDNVDNYSYIPMYKHSFMGQPRMFQKKKIDYLIKNGSVNWNWLGDYPKFPFNVIVNYNDMLEDGEGLKDKGYSCYMETVIERDGEDSQGHYKMQRISGEVRNATIEVTARNRCHLELAIAHEINHVFIAWKSGKLYTTNEKNHDIDKNEQIPMTSDLLARYELLYMSSKDGLEKVKNHWNNKVALYKKDKITGDMIPNYGSSLAEYCIMHNKDLCNTRANREIMAYNLFIKWAKKLK